MKFIRVANGRFHSDPPRKGCGVLRQTKKIHEWKWANEQAGFDPIAYGIRALGDVAVVWPCLHCFPECKP